MAQRKPLSLTDFLPFANSPPSSIYSIDSGVRPQCNRFSSDVVRLFPPQTLHIHQIFAQPLSATIAIIPAHTHYVTPPLNFNNSVLIDRAM